MFKQSSRVMEQMRKKVIFEQRISELYKGKNKNHIHLNKVKHNRKRTQEKERKS